MTETHSEEIERLHLDELDAERRYDDAVGREDHDAAILAATDWKNACNALESYLDQPARRKAA